MMEIGAALAAAGATLNLARAGLEARDEAKIKAAISDMGARLAAANSAALLLSEQARLLSAKLAEVEAELRDAKQRIAERERYVLHEIATGRFVYRFVPEGGNQTEVQWKIPVHYLCQACFDKGIKAVLRLLPHGDEDVIGRLLSCPESSRHKIVL